jgi:hypothetical protein
LAVTCLLTIAFDRAGIARQIDITSADEYLAAPAVVVATSTLG